MSDKQCRCLSDAAFFSVLWVYYVCSDCLSLITAFFLLCAENRAHSFFFLGEISIPNCPEMFEFSRLKTNNRILKGQWCTSLAITWILGISFVIAVRNYKP